MSTSAALFSRDFDSVEVGATFSSAGRTITESDVVAFAGLSGDFHPQHTDAVWAADSIFGERIAHGMLVLSYALGLVPFEPDRVMALRQIRSKFKAPVRLGDTIRAEGSVEAAKPLDARSGLVDTSWRVVNQDGAAVILASVQVVWRRDAAPAGGGEGGA
ncbi:MAG TPA: MaoC/PaaZ C-terminal domain-containing protein [Thermoleophilaceae bacterium]